MSTHAQVTLVARVNALMTRVRISRAVQSLEELSANASSLLVAVFEGVFSTSIADVRRKPGAARNAGGGGGSAAADYAFNAQRVVDSLKALLPTRVDIPATITGGAIAGGDLAAVAFIISVLDDAARALEAAGSGADKGEAKRILAELSDSTSAAATTAANDARSLPPVEHAESASTIADSAAWLAHAGSGGDIWSQKTPTKGGREKSAVKKALIGGAVSPPPVPSPRSSTARSSKSLSASAAESLRAQREGAGGEGVMLNDMIAEDTARRAAAVKDAGRRATGVMARLQHAAQLETQQISMMTDTAIREREAELRVMEARELKAATSRAKAAKHERKVLTMRTKLVVENITRATLSMRIARSSQQASATSAMLKALAGQARLAAADKLRVASSARASMLVDTSSRVAWLNHTSRLLNELMIEETARQVAQRQAATRSQKEALDRAIREMRLDEQALLKRMQEEQAHAEAAFLATQVEPMAVRAGDNASEIAAARLADPIDTDNDTARVDTLARMHRTLATGEARFGESRAAANRVVADIAKDVGGEIADAEALAAQGARLSAAIAK